MTEHWLISISHLPINQVKAHDSNWAKLESTQDFHWNCWGKGSLLPGVGVGVTKLVSLELLEAIIATVLGEELFEGEAFTEESIAEKRRLSLDVPLEPTMPEAHPP